MTRFLYFISILAIISCKNDQENADSAQTEVDTTAFQKKLNIDQSKFSLEPEARKFALNWVEYITAQNEIRQLESASINEVMSKAPAISQIMESLRKSVPDSLNSVAVESRLNVVSTKAQLLKQYSGRQDPNPKDIAQTTEELHLEFTNLKLQLNEIFLKSLEDFEKELNEFEELEREQDSIASPSEIIRKIVTSKKLQP